MIGLTWGVFVGKICKFVFFKLHKIMQANLNHWGLLHNDFSWVAVLIQSYLCLKIAENWVFKQILQFLFCKLCKINISRTKSQIINYIIIWIFFEGFSCWPKHGFICRLQRIEFLDIVFYYSSPSHVLHSADWCSANCSTWDGEVT